MVIEIFKADDATLTLTFTDSDGSIVNITDYTVWFYVKRNRTDTDANALISKTVTSHSDPTNGITIVTLTNSETNLTVENLYYGVKWLDRNSKVLTVKDGDFRIRQGVIQKTS